MITTQILYNPFHDRIDLWLNGQPISSSENRLYDMLTTYGYGKCLTPFQGRFITWRGLFVELMEEVNDDEIEVTFVGTDGDFQQLQKSLLLQVPRMEDAGYENHVILCHTQNFETPQLVEKILHFTEALREFSTSRSELSQIDRIISHLQSQPSSQQLDDYVNQIQQVMQSHLSLVAEEETDQNTWLHFQENFEQIRRW